MSNRQTIDDLPVVDATEPLILDILDCDIEHAIRQAEDDCAAVRAIMRQTNAIEAHVHRSRTYVRFDEWQWVRYQTPGPLRQETITFDKGGTFQPGRFKFPVLKPSQATGKRQGSNNTNRTGKMRQPPRVLTNVRPSA